MGWCKNIYFAIKVLLLWSYIRIVMSLDEHVRDVARIVKINTVHLVI